MWLEGQIGRRDIVPYIGCARALYDGGSDQGQSEAGEGHVAMFFSQRWWSGADEA
jgi:hypothetical protein